MFNRHFGTATNVVQEDYGRYQLDIVFDDHSVDQLFFPSDDVQRLITCHTDQQKVYAKTNESGDVALAYEANPSIMEVGDVVFVSHHGQTVENNKWFRGRVAKIHDVKTKTGKKAYDIVLDNGQV